MTVNNSASNVTIFRWFEKFNNIEYIFVNNARKFMSIYVISWLLNCCSMSKYKEWIVCITCIKSINNFIIKTINVVCLQRTYQINIMRKCSSSLSICENAVTICIFYLFNILMKYSCRLDWKYLSIKYSCSL